VPLLAQLQEQELVVNKVCSLSPLQWDTQSTIYEPIDSIFVSPSEKPVDPFQNLAADAYSFGMILVVIDCV
jgi:hypothetical protein